MPASSTTTVSTTMIAPPLLPFKLPLKSRPSLSPSRSSSSVSSSTTLASLRALYQRAARAFLQRNTEETQSLIDAAFRLLTPPAAVNPDLLSSQRKKWDILRITLETTLYTTSQVHSSHQGPSPSRTPSPSPASSAYNRASNLLLSPPSLLGSLHTRSLCLFTPTSQQPSPAFLPPEILVSLVLASIKLNCPQVGRSMIEEWLARRPLPRTSSPNLLGDGTLSKNGKRMAEDDGYAKVVDVYCLHVLPRLEDWEYAMEFMKYEVELSEERRMKITDALRNLHQQHLVAQQHAQSSQVSSSTSTSRRSSVALPLNGLDLTDDDKLSRSSSTSSFTAVPATPKPAHLGRTVAANGHTGAGSSSDADDSRPSSRASTIKYSSYVNGKGKQAENQAPAKPTTNLYHVVNASASSSSSSTSQNRRSSGEAIPLGTTGLPSSEPTTSSITTVTTAMQYFTLIRYQLSPYLQQVRSRLPLLVCAVLPLLAFLARWHNRIRPTAGGSSGSTRGTVQDVKRRLGVAGDRRGGGASVIAKVYKMLEDTIVMAGRGLV